MISTDLVILKNLPQVVNSSTICSGNTCLNSTDLRALKSLVFNETTEIYCVPSNNSAVSIYAGTGSSGSTDGARLNATFNYPIAVAITSNGTMFIAENHLIRRISPEGIVSRFAGSVSGFADGQGSDAKFQSPSGITMAPNGNLYVTELSNRIRQITPSGYVTTIAGSGNATFADGNGTSAGMNSPYLITATSDGILYFSDYSNNRIRKINGTMVTTFAGNGTGGATDGLGTSATFNGPWGITSDSSANLYVSELGNHKIRKITPAGLVTTVAGTGAVGSADGPGASATFNRPAGIVISKTGIIFVSDFFNHRIRKITPDGQVSTVVGSTAGLVDGIGIQAKLTNPCGITLSSNGTLYVSDWNNHAIRKINPVC